MDAPRIDPEALNAKLGSGADVTVLDVRRGSWHRSDAKVKGAVRVELDDVFDSGLELPEGAEVVAYCT